MEEIEHLTRMRSETLRLSMEGGKVSEIVAWTLSEEWTDGRYFIDNGLGRSTNGLNEVKGEIAWR